MLQTFNNWLTPLVNQTNSAISTVTSAYQPYAKPVNLASCISSIGLTFYGLFPLLSQQKEHDASPLAKLSLSMLYSLHIGSVFVALLQVTDQVDLASSTASALVGFTAMLKSFGDYAYESRYSANVNAEKEYVEQQFKKDNLELKCCLILIEDLKDTEYDLGLIEEERLLYLENLNKIDVAKPNLQAIFDDLKEIAQLKKLKQQALVEFNKTDGSKEASKELLDKINALIHAKGDQSLIDSLGNQYQHWIKYSKIKSSIASISSFLNDHPTLNQKTFSYLKLILDQLHNKLNPKGKNPRRSASILNVSFEKITKEWLTKYIKNNVRSLDREIKFLKDDFNLKQSMFADLSKFRPDDLHKDISSLYETMKKLIELQNQAELAAHSEKSKEKSANFSLISSVLAFSIWLIPNFQYTRRINQLKNGVGFLSLIIGNIDMIKKYILSMKLSAKEQRQLRQMLQDARFTHIVQLRDSLVKNVLLDKITEVGNGALFKTENEDHNTDKVNKGYFLRRSPIHTVKPETKRRVSAKKQQEKFTGARKSVSMYI